MEQGGGTGISVRLEGTHHTGVAQALCHGEQGVELGVINKADTLEELAEAAGLPAYPLAKTIEAYNAACDAGEDAEFGRDPETLLPLNNPPYYCWPIYPGGCSTLGGPKKNENAQVLDPAQNPIPRLYAAGCFGNFQSHTYGITGGNNAENQVWGRICARHAAGRART